MRKTLSKSAEIEEGSWVGTGTEDYDSLLDKLGLTTGQINRLRQGEFIAVSEDGDVWLCWDVKGHNVEIKVPKRVLRVYSNLETCIEPHPTPPGCAAACFNGDGPVDIETLTLYWSNDGI